MNQASSQNAEASPQRIAVAVVGHEGRYLVGQRAKNQTLGGLAEFPGGKVQSGETPVEAVVRECREETGLVVEVTGAFDPIVYAYPHGTLELHFFACRWKLAGQLLEPFRWATPEELGQLEFPAANRPILAAILGRSLRK